MNFVNFSRKSGANGIIDMRNMINYFEKIDRRRLYEWQQKGYITKITNNYYFLSDANVNDDVLKNMASVIYAPSYIGLESALTYYQFIPEAVFQTVSITTRRNKTFDTNWGGFKFHSIQKSLFFGIKVVSYNKGFFTISDPEKTLLDFLYFSKRSDRPEFFDEARLNWEEIFRVIDLTKLKDYLQLFSSFKIDRGIKILMEKAHVEFS